MMGQRGFYHHAMSKMRSCEKAKSGPVIIMMNSNFIVKQFVAPSAYIDE